MTTRLEDDIFGTMKTKWQTLQSHYKRAIKTGNCWDTTVEYKFANGEELAFRAETSDGDGYIMPTYVGFEYLYVDASHLDLRADFAFEPKVTCRSILGFAFTRWVGKGMPVTLSGVVAYPRAENRQFGAIKYPDGGVEPLLGEHDATLSMSVDNTSGKFASDEEWLACMHAYLRAVEERERASETGKDADGNPACREFFGGCPTCGKSGVLNVGRSHWGICDTHKTKWAIGSNLSSSWRDETDADWITNSARLAEYAEVAPLAPGETIPGPVPETTDAEGMDNDFPL